MVGFIEGVAMFFPCKMCSKDFTDSIRIPPPTYIRACKLDPTRSPFDPIPIIIQGRVAHQPLDVALRPAQPCKREARQAPLPLQDGKKGNTELAILDPCLDLYHLNRPNTKKHQQSCIEKRWKRSNENACFNDEADAPSYAVGDCATDH